jgi:hypothetical protein
MNAAFEDCLLLARLLTEHKPRRTAGRHDLGEALDRFQTERKPNADAIADMALENFVEMRDKTGSPAFLYRKKVEQTVHHFFPQRVTPQYNLVSFSTVPYTEARRRGRALDAVLDTIIERLPRDSVAATGEQPWKERVRGLADELLTNETASREGEDAQRGQADPAPPPHRASAQVLDITPAVTQTLGVWPGDTPLSREVLCDIEKGDNITLSTLRARAGRGSGSGR